MLIPYQNNLPQLGSRTYVAPGAILIGHVSLGEDASVFFHCVLRADINVISIGARSNIQDNSTVHVSSLLGTYVGSDVSVGHNCVIHACKVADRVLVGMGSILMDGVEVGEDCIIGAGSLLTRGRKFPSGSLIMGNPAKVARVLTIEEIASIAQLANKYVGVKDHYRDQQSGGM